MKMISDKAVKIPIRVIFCTDIFMLPPLYHSVSRGLTDYFYHKLVRCTNDGLSCVGYLSCMNTGLVRAICDRHPNASLANGYGISAVFCFYLKGILLIGGKVRNSLYELAVFIYLGRIFSALSTCEENKYQARSDNSRKSCRPCEILSFYHCRTPLFTVYLLL
nr:MAG TPA: hypothetical protein [Caudoviricetes sp.]